jgi:hypothetical protein
MSNILCKNYSNVKNRRYFSKIPKYYTHYSEKIEKHNEKHAVSPVFHDLKKIVV